MSLESKLHECIYNDDVSELNRILGENDIDTMKPIIFDKLFAIAQFGSINIFNRVIKIPAVELRFSENAEARKSFLSTVLGHSSLPLVNRVFEIPLFTNEIINDPYAALLSVATNNNCAPQALAKIHELTSVDEFIASNPEQSGSIWLKAYVNYNHSASNCFLEFPTVFTMVSAMDPKHSEAPNYINTNFMEYYFAKSPQQNLTEKETKLAYLILQTLIKTYPDRVAIRNRVKSRAEFEERSSRSNNLFYKASIAARHLREKYLPDTQDIHEQRIERILAIPAVSRMARDNILAVTVEDEAKRLLAKVPARRRALLY